jgi:alpha-1,3-rhamnosyl/mannosyltransferase
LGLAPGYLLHVGTIEPRKNILTLLRAYCALPEALRDRVPLVLAGGWGWGHAEVAAYYYDTARHRNVKLTGFIRDDDLAALYSAARALVFPTHYEGFGLPPLEMMACGGAVLASTAAAVREVVGECGFLIDPRDEAGWRIALSRAIIDDDWCSELRRGTLERAAEFTWDRCARATLDVYRAACAVHPQALAASGTRA